MNTYANVKVEVNVRDIINKLTDDDVKEIYYDRFDFEPNTKQQIIDIVFDNDKKTALHELESLFGGMYTGWEKV